MTRIARIDMNRLQFTTIPDKRVAEIDAALDAQRANRRTATDDLDRGTAERNIADLEGALERANVNLQAYTERTTRLEAERKAKADEADARALAAITDQMRANFLAQPGTTAADFERALPDLLTEHRKAAVLNAPAVREQQLAEAKRRMGRLF